MCRNRVFNLNCHLLRNLGYDCIRMLAHSFQYVVDEIEAVESSDLPLVPQQHEWCWLVGPERGDWDIGWYFTVRGAESLHLYLWVLKDLSWTQDWLVTGYIFGILATLWSAYLIVKAGSYRNWREVWIGIGQFLWLFANLW